MANKRKYILCYFIYAAAWLFLHTLCGRFGDDTGPFSPFAFDAYLNGRFTWSSRFFLSLFGNALRRPPMAVWVAVDTIMVVATTLLLNAIFNRKKEIKEALLMMGIFCLFPFPALSGAGWITTTMVYFWVITAALYDIFIAERIRERKKVLPYQYVAATMSFIVAMDVETGAVAMFVIFFGYSILQAIDKNKNRYVYALAAVSMGRIVFDVLWKGNAARYASEMEKWFPDYKMLGLADKIVLGFSTSAYAVYITYWMPVLILTILVCAIVFEARKDLFSRTVSVAALGIAGIYPLGCLFSGLYGELYARFSEYAPKYGLISFTNYNQPDGYIVMFVWGSGLLSIVYSLVSIKDSIKSVFIWAVFLIAGFGSRFIMGFSPTVAASGDRTASWLFFSILVCLAGIYMEWEAKDVKVKNAIACGIMLAGGLTFLNSLFFACRH